MRCLCCGFEYCLSCRKAWMREDHRCHQNPDEDIPLPLLTLASSSDGGNGVNQKNDEAIGAHPQSSGTSGCAENNNPGGQKDSFENPKDSKASRDNGANDGGHDEQETGLGEVSLKCRAAPTTGLLLLFNDQGACQQVVISFELSIQPSDIKQIEGDKRLFTDMEMASFSVNIPKSTFDQSPGLPIFSMRRAHITLGPSVDHMEESTLPQHYGCAWHILRQHPSKSWYKSLPTTFSGERSTALMLSKSPGIQISAKKGKTIQKSPIELDIELEKSPFYAANGCAHWEYQTSVVNTELELESDFKLEIHQARSVVLADSTPSSIEASVSVVLEVTEAGSKTFFKREMVCGKEVGCYHFKALLQTDVMWKEDGAQYPSEKSGLGGPFLVVQHQIRGGCATASSPRRNVFNSPGSGLEGVLLLDDPSGSGRECDFKDRMWSSTWRRWIGKSIAQNK